MSHPRDYRPLPNGSAWSSALNVALDIAGSCLTKMKPLKPVYKVGYQTGLICAEVLSRATQFRTTEEDPLWVRMRLLTHTYEVDTVRLVRRIAKPGMVALDIGANVGYYTRLLSTLVESSGLVVAFEPQPRNFALLRQNTGALNNVNLIEMAVGQLEGRAILYDSLSESGGSSLRYDPGRVAELRDSLGGRALAPRVLDNLATFTYDVKTVSVDSFLSKQQIRQVHIVKMDIEGAELDALRGMEDIVQASKHMAMFIELNPRALRQFDSDPLQLWSKLCDMNFEVWAIYPAQSLTRLTNKDSVLELTEKIHGHVNLFCTKK